MASTAGRSPLRLGLRMGADPVVQVRTGDRVPDHPGDVLHGARDRLGFLDGGAKHLALGVGGGVEQGGVDISRA